MDWKEYQTDTFLGIMGARLADVLAARKPSQPHSTSAAAWVAAEWYATVREIADALYDRPDWTKSLTESGKRWIGFTDRAGYPRA